MSTKRNRLPLLAVLLLAALWLQAQPPCNLDVQIEPPSAAISCQSPSVQLSVTVSPSGGDLHYNWWGPAQLPNVSNPTVTVPGTYSLFVLDSLSGCWGNSTVAIAQDGALPQLSIAQTGGVHCDGTRTLQAQLTPGSPGDYTYLWSNGATTQSISAAAGTPGTAQTYCVTATNSSGCSVARCLTLAAPVPFQVQVYYFDPGNCADSLGMWATVQGGQSPYAYVWNNGVAGPWQPSPSAGTYVVTATDANGCTAVSTLVVESAAGECAHIEGFVWADWDSDCATSTGDSGLGGNLLRFTDGTGVQQYSYTTANGFYRKQLDPGTYTVEVVPPNHLWSPCQASFSITPGQGETAQQDFFLQPMAVCPAMTVDIGTPFLRRCFTGTYAVLYCNNGTVTANGAFVDISLDPFLSLTGASLPFANLGNNQYRFELGDVPMNTCGSLYLNVLVSCDATLGQTHCTEALIHPTGNCEPPSAQWSGASLQVEGGCDADSLAFSIRNVGFGVTSVPLEYVIIEDAVMFMQAPPPAIYLAPGEAHQFKVPANGATWRVQVEQEPFHPGQSMPSQAVEGCANGGQFSVGFVNQFQMDDNDPWVDVDCTANIGAYDPNDKQGFPIGYGAARYVEPGTDIEYLVRFQNTGTDTAFTVVVRDELSPWLDPSTVRPGASSHPYTFAFYGDRNIKFVFDNINLPDSSKNLAGSQGFVSFKISQQANVPLETDIYNKAAIFFDFNAPIVTNTTVHRVGRDFVTLSAWQPFRPGLALRLLPNPVAETAILELQGMDSLGDWQLEMLDATGRTIRRASAVGNRWQLERGDLPSGVYILQVRAQGQVLGTGKAVFR